MFSSAGHLYLNMSQEMVITTERLRLREFTELDWEAVLAYQTHPAYLRYYPWTGRTAADVRSFVQRFIDWQQEQPRCKYQLAVILVAEGQLIGNCGLRLERPGATEAELGYELNPAYWHQGYASEAARAMGNFGFTELGLHRIWASCLAKNVGSARLLDKLGMRREGQLRQKHWFKGRWWDTLLYGLLEDEWRP